jgi:hypothetical protein
LVAAFRTDQKHESNLAPRGGPTHVDTFDLKPDAPVEIRGEFRPIATKARSRMLLIT